MTEPITNIGWREFFDDRSWSIPPGEDSMRPAREVFNAEELTQAMNVWLTHGNYTSRELRNEHRSIMSCDGMPLFSTTHTRPWAGGMTFTNLLASAPTLSLHAFMDALRGGRQNGIYTPDTLIVGPHESMIQKAKAMQEIMHDVHHWTIDICIADCLKDLHLYHWFLASRKNSGLHYRNLGHGFHEICALRWDWIIASLSTIQPTNL